MLVYLRVHGWDLTLHGRHNRKGRYKGTIYNVHRMSESATKKLKKLQT